jgi:hypothetical protein
MGKRSDFERVPRDFYPTPKEAVVPLLPHLPKGTTFAEPCAGNCDLIDHLVDHGYVCNWASDIEESGPEPEMTYGLDALTLTEKQLEKYGGCDYIITNPPWSRDILHPMINHFRTLRPTWLLFDSDWAYTKQSKEYMKNCEMIVAVGRVKWIPDSKMTGKDNCSWYLFSNEYKNNFVRTEFIGR